MDDLDGVVVVRCKYRSDTDEWQASLIHTNGTTTDTPDWCEDLPTALEYLAVPIAHAITGD